MNLKDCYNFDDFRKLAKKKLPAPIFHYIDGGADDEITLKRFEDTLIEATKLKVKMIPQFYYHWGHPEDSKTKKKNPGSINVHAAIKNQTKIY